MIKKIRNYFEEIQFEMKKVSWPTWDELKGSTYVVLSFSVLVATFLFVVDLVLNKILSIIL
jgi:preprotein translocase subunit SecE